MNLRNNKTVTRLASVALCLGGLFAASVTMAGGSGYDNDDDDSGLYDDDDGYRRQSREPRFRDKGDTLQAHVEVKGLRGNRNVRAHLEASAEVEIECERYGGGYGYGRDHRKEVDIEVDGVEYFSRHRIHGNDLDVWIETDDIRDELRDYYGDDLCPGRARADIRSVQFSDAKLEISQGRREIVTWLCSFDYDTRNGTVPSRAVDCVTLY